MCPRDHYRPTPIPGLLLHPTILLLNLIVRTAEDNTKTDGRIPPETVDVVTAIIRDAYDFPDLDLAQGKGVLLSCIGQFFHVADPEALAQGREKTLALWYKQRFLSLCFVGEKTQLDKLRGNVSAELLNQVLGVIWQGVDVSQESYVIPHPAFVPAPRFRGVSQQNAIEWAEQMKQLMSDVAERGTMAELTVIGPPEPTYTVQLKNTDSRTSTDQETER